MCSVNVMVWFQVSTTHTYTHTHTHIKCIFRKQYKRDENRRRSHASGAIMRKLILHFARSGRKRCRGAKCLHRGEGSTHRAVRIYTYICTQHRRIISARKGERGKQKQNTTRENTARENLKRARHLRVEVPARFSTMYFNDSSYERRYREHSSSSRAF